MGHCDQGRHHTEVFAPGELVTFDINDPAVNPDLPGVDVLDDQLYSFGVGDDGTATAHNANKFKKIKGFGGLVLTADGGDPVTDATVELRDGNGGLIETMATDDHGWYLSEYWHKGNSADYELVLLNEDGQPLETQVVQVGKKIKFGQANFYV